MDAPTLRGVLPLEVMDIVLKHLDVNTDRAAFLSLLRVSSVYWHMAARVLYRNVDISGRKMRKLLRNKTGHLTDRQRTALSFIKRLDLMNLEPGNLESMNKFGIPNVPLFPNVYKVHIYFTKPAPDYREPWPRPADDLLIFSSPDMCSWDGGQRLPSLHIRTRTIGTLSVHAVDVPGIFATPFHVQFRRKPGFATLYIKEVDSLTLCSQTTVYLGQGRDKSLNSQARVWVGKYNSLFDEYEPPRWPISTGPWESTADVDCRIDSNDYQLPPCPVCGGKGDLGARNFGCVFTVAW
ncbi:uncharacterized protein LOC62_01G001033 [Vanrija pseudolonga]|uniref:Uncharacterized protein n=1 Tax=Vanrija pseudolonga TaxID=143232 RepID=A0AAF0Y3P7_9TREE|nr:hypothetical protein LOC62_01G001033 [Vanrija pseudolonga]